jgi:hypothetical protein
MSPGWITSTDDRSGRPPVGEAPPPLVRTAWKRLAKRAKAVLADESELSGGAPDDERQAGPVRR